MALLGREAILEAKDMKTKDIPVPEWGGDVRIRMLSGRERDDFEASMVDMRKDGSQVRNIANLRARLVSLCAVNEAGERLFSPPDIKLLGEKSAAALQRVFNACQELNAVSDDDVEELAEGFSSDPAGSSTSD